MKRYLSAFFLLFISATSTIFAQTADVTIGCVPLIVNFKAPYSANGYYWDFKSGPSANIEEPSASFTTPGVYDVVLKEGVNGKVVGTIQITALPKPTLSFTVGQAVGCAPLTTTFTNTSVINPAIVVTNYKWVFGDGTTQFVENPSKTFSTLGKSNVSFDIITNFKQCDVTYSVNDVIEIISPPVADFTTNPSNPYSCNPSLNVSFTNTSTGVKPLKYDWDFKNTNVSSSSTPPSQTYTTGGYNPQLTVSYNGIVGCSATRLVGVSVGKPSANFKIDADSICLENELVFATKSQGLLNWTIGSFPNQFSTSLDSNRYKFSAAGTYPVQLIVTSYNGLCADTATQNVFVESNTASLEVTPDFSCENPSVFKFKAISANPNVTYEWSSGNSTASEIFVSVDTKDTAYYSKNIGQIKLVGVKITSNGTGCVVTTPFLGSFAQAPNALYFPSRAKGCIPFEITLTDSSTSWLEDTIKVYEWHLDNGVVITNTKNTPLDYVYTVPGVYKPFLIVTTKGGCKDTSYAHVVEVGDKIPSEIDFVADKVSVCPGEDVVFTVNKTSNNVDYYHFYTESNRSFNNPKSNTLTWAYKNEIGPQDVSLVVDYNGCLTTITKSALVNVKGAIAKIDYSALCTAPKVYNFKSKSLGASGLNWNFGDASSSNLTDVSHTYANTGNYKIILTASSSDGCNPTYDTVNIKVRQVKAVASVDPYICINTNKTFTGTSSVDARSGCGYAYTWHFSDPARRPLSYGSSTADFQFSKSGRDSVKLVVEDDNGCKDTTQVFFKVFDIIVQASLDKQRICTPNSVLFTNLSTHDTTITSYSWSFGDNKFSSLASLTHLYNSSPSNSNIFKAKLILTDALGCIDSASFPITQYSPVSTISASDKTICLGDTITFSASDYILSGSSLDFSWDFGNGVPSITKTNKVLYPIAKTYKIKLNFVEKSTGCSSADSTTIDIQSYPIANFKSDVDTIKVLCAPKNISFSDSSISATPLNYYWNFGQGRTSGSKDYAILLNEGTYDIKHVVTTSYGCSDTIVKTKRLYFPKGDFDMDDNLICKGDKIKFNIKDTAEVISYKWDFGDGYIDQDKGEIIHQYNFHPPSGTTLATLILYSFDKSCPKPKTKPVNIYKVIAQFDRLSTYKEKIEKDSSICAVEGKYKLINKNIGATSFLWNFGDGTTSTNNNDSLHFYNPGKYDVSMSIIDNVTGCTDSISKTIFVYKNPEIESVGDTVCLGSNISLAVKNPVSSSLYMWQPNTGLSDDSIFNPIATLTNSQTYRAIVQDTNRCYDTTLVYAGIVRPIDLYDWDTTIVIGDQVTLPVTHSSFYNFAWTPSTDLSCLACTDPLVRPLKDQTYNLVVTDILGCFTNNFDYKITVKPETFVKLPTSFTPNGDGNNDIIYVEGWGVKQLLEYKVFNRWGEVIFTSNSMDEGWDGKFKGEVQNGDAYVYKVKALTWRDQEIVKEGYINLIR
jgi:gliding motility-associated-like protein